MADLDSRPVSSVRDFTPIRPTLPPPEQVTSDEHGHRHFSIQTAKGTISVQEWFREWQLRGTAEALEAFGAIHLEWLPGRTGNGKTRQTVVFAPDGRIFLGSWRGSGLRALPHISIAKSSGEIITVHMRFNGAERAQFDEFQRQREQRKTWETAKSIRQDRDFIGDWQKAILTRIDELEGLIAGRRYFTGLPEIGLRVREQKPILAALADAKAWAECCSPQFKDAMRKDNVYSLNGEAYRRLAGQ